MNVVNYTFLVALRPRRFRHHCTIHCWNDPTVTDSASASGEFEISEPIWLSSMQHGYFVAGGDHQLTMTIGQHFATDLFYSCETNTLKTDKIDPEAMHQV